MNMWNKGARGSNMDRKVAWSKKVNYRKNLNLSTRINVGYVYKYAKKNLVLNLK